MSSSSKSNNNLSLVTRDQVGRWWNLWRHRGGKIRTDAYGFASADFSLDRDFAFAWDDIGLNNQIFFYSPWGDVAFHGRLDAITPTWQDGVSSLVCIAKGYRDSAADLNFNGTLIGTPQAKIAALISGGYLPQLSSDTSGLITTGIASGTTATPNSGTDDQAVWEVILNICKSGTSTGQKVLPQVWDDRRLITKAVDMISPSPRYIVDRRNVSKISLSRTLSDTYTQVEVRYKDSVDGSLQRLLLPSVPGAIALSLGIDFTGGGTVTPFVRTRILDITGILPDGCDAATATNAGTALLNQEQRVKNSSDSIVIERDYVIFDQLSGQEIPGWAARGGEWLQVNGFSPWPSEIGTGTSAGDKTIQSMFFISGTEFDIDSRVLTVTPESAGDLASVISDRLGGGN